MKLNNIDTEFARLNNPKSIADHNKLIDVYINFFILVINNHKENFNTVIQNEAKILLQMVTTKTLYFKKLIKGVNFYSKSLITLNNIADPTVLAVLIRNVYETVALFNLIFRANNEGDERLIIYNLWCIAGFKYRQRFKPMIGIEDSLILAKEEKDIDIFIR